jgi:hypothetical protein
MSVAKYGLFFPDVNLVTTTELLPLLHPDILQGSPVSNGQSGPADGIFPAFWFYPVSERKAGCTVFGRGEAISRIRKKIIRSDLTGKNTLEKKPGKFQEGPGIMESH